MIDGKIRGLFRFTFSKEDLVKKSTEIGRDMATTMATRDLADVGARIKHMDELGIDIQVLYPSIFLDQCTERADTEVALCGAYNRWLADVWRKSWAPALAGDLAVAQHGRHARSTEVCQGARRLRRFHAPARRNAADYRPLLFSRCTNRRRRLIFVSACTSPMAALRPSI